MLVVFTLKGIPTITESPKYSLFSTIHELLLMVAYWFNEAEIFINLIWIESFAGQPTYSILKSSFGTTSEILICFVIKDLQPLEVKTSS